MIPSISIIIRICISIFLIHQACTPAIAFKRSNVGEYTLEDQRTQRRENYILKRAMDNELSGNRKELETVTTTDYFDDEKNPEELPSLIVDYANMIRNDIILLDNSVETRTRKRGNIKVEKYNQPFLDVPCSCERIPDSKQIIDLGEEYFPRIIETKNCSKRLCPSTYKCQKTLYNLTILKKNGRKEESQMEVPNEFKLHRWVAISFPVTIGCVCIRDHVDMN